MLDAIRYMVVWNPLILIALHTVFTFLGLDKHDHNHQQVHTIPLGSSQHPAPL